MSVPGPPQDRPPEEAMGDDIYTPLDPLGNGDLLPSSGGEDGGESAETPGDAPAFDADVSPEGAPEDDAPEPDSGVRPGGPGPF